MFQPDTHELAWAAGFFDGEGYTGYRAATGAPRKDGSYRPGGYRHVQVDVRQVDRQALDRFQAAVGGVGKVGGPYGPYDSRPGTQPHHCFRTMNFADTQAVIAMLWKYLGPIKRAQASAALRAYHTKVSDSVE